MAAKRNKGYSNLGYFVVAEIITSSSGIPWNQYLAAMIFEPAGMAATQEDANGRRVTTGRRPRSGSHDYALLRASMDLQPNGILARNYEMTYRRTYEKIP